MFATVILAYFDLRRQVPAVDRVFLIANLGLTWITRELGCPDHGCGYSSPR
jgi:uncharacterized membrane protein